MVSLLVRGLSTSERCEFLRESFSAMELREALGERVACDLRARGNKTPESAGCEQSWEDAEAIGIGGDRDGRQNKCRSLCNDIH